MFVRSKQGDALINLHHAIEVRRSGYESYAVMADGRVIALADEITDIEIRNEADGVVAAQGGYEALVFHGELDAELSETWVQREPVLAWRISEQTAVPVTIDQDIKPTTIKRPDGSVCDPWDRDWANEDAWLEDMRKRHEETRARRKAMRDAK